MADEFEWSDIIQKLVAGLKKTEEEIRKEGIEEENFEKIFPVCDVEDDEETSYENENEENYVEGEDEECYEQDEDVFKNLSQRDQNAIRTKIEENGIKITNNKDDESEVAYDTKKWNDKALIEEEKSLKSYFSNFEKMKNEELVEEYQRLSNETQTESNLEKMEKIKTAIVVKNKNLVWSRVKIFKKGIEYLGLSDTDIFYAGVTGMLESILKYKKEKGTKFSTFATTIIDIEIYNEKMHNSKLNIKEDFYKKTFMPMLEIKNNYKLQKGEEMPEEDLYKELKKIKKYKNEKTYKEKFELLKRCMKVWFEEIDDDEKKERIEKFYEESSNNNVRAHFPQPDSKILNEEKEKAINELLSILTEDEEKTVRYRVGLFEYNKLTDEERKKIDGREKKGEILTLQETGEKLGVSHTMVSKRERTAYKKIVEKLNEDNALKENLRECLSIYDRGGMGFSNSKNNLLEADFVEDVVKRYIESYIGENYNKSYKIKNIDIKKEKENDRYEKIMNMENSKDSEVNTKNMGAFCIAKVKVDIEKSLN